MASSLRSHRLRSGIAVCTWVLLAACVGGTRSPRVTLLKDCPRCPQLVIVPAGSAMTGGNADETAREHVPAELAARELPAHRVTLSRPLAVGRYEVTNDEYAVFVAATGRVEPAGCMILDVKTDKWIFDAQRSRGDPGFAQSGRNPAVCVSWNDAHAYAAWLSTLTGHRYRLPSETEWEYAARGGTQSARFWGDDRGGACGHANVADVTLADLLGIGNPDPETYFLCRDGHAYTAPVGSFAPNAFGLYDVNGNVWEWMADCYNETLAGAPGDGRAREGDCTSHMDRGGSWVNSPKYLRTAARHKDLTTMKNTVLGLRVVRDLD